MVPRLGECFPLALLGRKLNPLALARSEESAFVDAGDIATRSTGLIAGRIVSGTFSSFCICFVQGKLAFGDRLVLSFARPWWSYVSA
jgi:hypothetical protein